MQPFLSDRAYIPRHMVSPKRWKNIAKLLRYVQYSRDTVSSTAKAKEHYGAQKAQRQIVTNIYLSEDARYYTVPRRFALEQLTKISFRDSTVFPAWDKQYPMQIKPRDEKQQKFFTGVLEQALRPGPQHILANATTGSGKSVAMIRLGMDLKTPTLIVVDSNKIAAGFIKKNFEKFFGKKWTYHNVGRIQQDRCDYKGKPFAIAMVQSLVARKYPKEMYEYFGCVCFDEVQIYGNEAYHHVLGKFSARVLAGFTATNKNGQFGRVITGYLGKPAVVSKQEVMKPNIHVVRYVPDYRIRIYSDGILLNDLTAKPDRNNLIADIAYDGFNRGRVCLVLSERIAQLQYIQKRLIHLGVPKKEVGLHVGEYEADHWTVGYSYDNERWIKLKDMQLSRKDAAGTATMLNRASIVNRDGIPTALAKKIQKGETVFFQPIRNTVKPSQDELDSIASNCHIILATYQIFAKGVDYPRIDMGIEGSPVGNVTQPLGRTLRLPEGFEKPTPEWWSIYDNIPIDREELFGSSEDRLHQSETLNAFFDAKHEMRKKGYKTAQGTVTYHDADDIRSKRQ